MLGLLDAHAYDIRPWSTTLTETVVLVADAGEMAGLGHISRASALAVALRCRGIEACCFAQGVADSFERDGVSWTPLDEEQPPLAQRGVLIVDSYRLPPDKLAAAAGSARLVVMHDHGEVPVGAALVVAAAAQRSSDDDGWLSGLGYAALRPAFWGLPVRDLRDPVRRIVVTTGGGRFGELGCELAQAVGEALPGVSMALVRGPQAAFAMPEGIESIDAPDSLLEPLLAADLVISAGGQTMLEAAACGTPCVALALVDNQRRQALRLAALGAVRLVDPPGVSGVVAAARELVRAAATRRELSRNGQQAVDGYGALRVAFHVACLLTEGR